MVASRNHPDALHVPRYRGQLDPPKEVCSSSLLVSESDSPPPARRKFGRGRYIPVHEDKVRVHESVEKRIKEVGYTPKATNWREVSPRIKYVK